MTSALRDTLHAILTTRCGDALAGWLDRALPDGPDATAHVLAAYTAAPRRLGRAALSLQQQELSSVAPLAPGVTFDRWTVFDAARVLLLLTLADRLPQDRFFDLAVACYEQGDGREQESWLRALALLPVPERFVAHAIDACRSNILPVFEAVACDNPYPARYFPEPNFNQLILKALFVGAPLARVFDLPARRNDTLSRMALDYAAERRAAGRTVPADLPLAVLAHPSPETPAS